MQHNRITELFNIQYPIIQAGMIWASGWKLASAVSNAGGLGIIGAGSMYPMCLKNISRNVNLLLISRLPLTCHYSIRISIK